HGGTIRADGAVATGDGRIVLKATRNATLEAGSVTSASGPAGGQVLIQSGEATVVGGTIDATGSAGKGGTVQVLGNLVGLVDNASINVSGEAGGGTALVGGDLQGKNPNVQNAFRTYFGPDATIRADALGNGDGGKVVVWSEDATRAFGTISARGGSQGGDGGFVEVSSRGWLDFHARVDTRAPRGRTGTLLLDPSDVTICGDCSSGEGGFSNPGSGGTPGTPNIWTNDSSETTVDWSDIENNLQYNKVIITTSGTGSAAGNIAVDNSYSLSGSASNDLWLVAHNNVDVNADISGPGGLRIYAGWNETASPVSSLVQNNAPAVTQGTGDINVNGASINMQGNILFQAGRNISVASAVRVENTGSGVTRSVTFNAGNKIHLDGSTVRVDVSGGEAGGAATVTFTAGAGGILAENESNVEARSGDGDAVNSGPAAINWTSSGPIAVKSGSRLWAQSGTSFGANSGAASVVLNSGNNMLFDSGEAQAVSGSADSGRSGPATVELIASGNIDILESYGTLYASTYNGGGPQGSGDATVRMSSGGNLNVQDSWIGAEGRYGGLARVLMAANGSLMIGGESYVGAYSYGVFSGGTGTASEVSITGADVLINGGSYIEVIGGASSTTGGGAQANVTAANGQLRIENVYGVSSRGGFGEQQGGNAATTLAGANGVSIVDSGTYYSQGVRSQGGESYNTGGNASVLVQSNAGNISSIRSSVVAEGGEGINQQGGSGLTRFLAPGGGVTIDGASALSATVAGYGGVSDGGTGGIGEVDLFAQGPIVINSDSVYAGGGYGADRGGDGQAFAVTPSTFTMTDATFAGYGGYSQQQGGNGLLGVTASTITATSSGVPATLIASGGSSSTGGVLGGGHAVLTALGPTGTINLNNEVVSAIGGEMSGPSGTVYGPASITLAFPGRATGGWFVNGNEGAITVGGASGSEQLIAAAVGPSGAGFFVNGRPAIPGVNFFVDYGGLENLPDFQAQLIASLVNLADLLTGGTITEDTGADPGGSGFEKKKNLCSG
ncbi:MAG: hypothetical protein IT529_22085, partial [Burkholderiales bacterium]|nr:hypothetical protein [Burkholderiales bacterium]